MDQRNLNSHLRDHMVECHWVVLYKDGSAVMVIHPYKGKWRNRGVYRYRSITKKQDKISRRLKRIFYGGTRP
jgi:hypothetical protein